jgi:hypothetical protein
MDGWMDGWMGGAAGEPVAKASEGVDTMSGGEDLRRIPGIGRTFVKDFARIGITRVAELRGAEPDRLFRRLERANAAEEHATSRNYLYVIRMAVYFANGGRDPAKLKWNAWKD